MIRRMLKSAFSFIGVDAFFFRRHDYTDYVCLDRNILEWHYNRERERALYEESMAKTGMQWSDNFTKQCRHYTLQSLARQVLSQNLSGEFAECGCWKGTSSYQLASLIAESGKKLHIFDSFEGGLSDKTANDTNVRVDMSKDEIEHERQIFSSTEREVRENLSGFQFIDYHPGWIPQRFSDVEQESFCFVHVDVDLYEPTRDSLEFFWERLVDGGIIVIDDYGYTQFPGARKAVQEFLRTNAVSLFLDSPIGGCFLQK